MAATIFDMDGLLVDTEPLWHEAEHEVFHSLGLPLTPEMCLQTAGLRIDEVSAHWRKIYPWQGRTDQQVANDIVDRVIEKVKQRATLLPGVIGAIEASKGLGYRVGLASSSPMRLIEVIVDHFSLRGYFEILHSGEVEELGKPHPATFLSAARKLDTDPTDCIALEDSFHGLISCTAARMKTIVVPAEIQRGLARWVIADLKLESLEECTRDLLKNLMEK